MTDYEFHPSVWHPTFGRHAPVLRLHSGDSVTTHLPDAHGLDHLGGRVADFSNPLVGPFFIEGLSAGDGLSVTLDEVAPASRKGWSYLYPTAATVEPSLYSLLPQERTITDWDVDLEAGFARPAQSTAGSGKPEIPLAPMIGCLGVAPALSQAISSYASGSFGGNMDCPLLTAGCRVDLPVYVDGGLLFIGDCHAAQSHGEITGAAVEVPGRVRFTVQAIKNAGITWPRGRNADSLFTIGSGRPLDIALQRATSEMIRWLTLEFQVDKGTACLWMGQGVRYVISNAVNELGTMACVLPRRFIE